MLYVIHKMASRRDKLTLQFVAGQKRPPQRILDVAGLNLGGKPLSRSTRNLQRLQHLATATATATTPVSVIHSPSALSPLARTPQSTRGPKIGRDIPRYFVFESSAAKLHEGREGTQKKKTPTARPPGTSHGERPTPPHSHLADGAGHPAPSPPATGGAAPKRFFIDIATKLDKIELAISSSKQTLRLEGLGLRGARAAKNEVHNSVSSSNAAAEESPLLSASSSSQSRLSRRKKTPEDVNSRDVS